MRKSLQDLDQKFVKKINDYPGLPDELVEYCYYLADSGIVIMAVPETLLKTLDPGEELWNIEVGMPVRYVLDTGYRFQDGYVIVDADYDDEYGLMVDEKYSDY